MFPITLSTTAFISHSLQKMEESSGSIKTLFFFPLFTSSICIIFDSTQNMASPQNWFEVPSFDLGIDTNPEDLSLLVVEDSLDGDGESNLIQDTLFEGEVVSKSDVEVTTKQTWEFEDVAFAGQYKNNFDLNKAPNEDGSSVNVGGECGLLIHCTD
ncbi:hypothetical protein OROGR_014711 [Orobanche gracilis]